MKTIRYNTFETNSSSTHAYSVSSVNLKNRVDLNIIPDENGEIRLRLTTMDEDITPQAKISHMLLYANTTGNQEMFDRIVQTVEDHTGGKLYVEARVWNKDKWVDVSPLTTVSNPRMIFESDDDETVEANHEEISDTFYSFASEYGHGCVEEFIDDMEDIGSSTEKLKIFFFSSKQGVHIESYYN